MLIYYALRVWGEAAPLTFHEVGGHSADISVEFLQREHGDGSPFDGPGGMVAHAFFPGDPQRAGNVHFDSEEDWTFRAPGEPWGHGVEDVSFSQELGISPAGAHPHPLLSQQMTMGWTSLLWQYTSLATAWA